MTNGSVAAVLFAAGIVGLVACGEPGSEGDDDPTASRPPVRPGPGTAVSSVVGRFFSREVGDGDERNLELHPDGTWSTEARFHTDYIGPLECGRGRWTGSSDGSSATLLPSTGETFSFFRRNVKSVVLTMEDGALVARPQSFDSESTLEYRLEGGLKCWAGGAYLDCTMTCR